MDGYLYETVRSWEERGKKFATEVHRLRMSTHQWDCGILIVLSCLGHVLGDETWYYLAFMGTLEWELFLYCTFLTVMP